MDIRKNIFSALYFDPSSIRIFDNRFSFKLDTHIDEKIIFINNYEFCWMLYIKGNKVNYGVEIFSSFANIKYWYILI